MPDIINSSFIMTLTEHLRFCASKPASVDISWIRSARSKGRPQDFPWEAIKQASIIQELRDRFGNTLEGIAKSLGRDKSWVKRQLVLITE